jgi:hypothetical protein
LLNHKKESERDRIQIAQSRVKVGGRQPEKVKAEENVLEITEKYGMHWVSSTRFTTDLDNAVNKLEHRNITGGAA